MTSPDGFGRPMIVLLQTAGQVIRDLAGGDPGAVFRADRLWPEGGAVSGRGGPASGAALLLNAGTALTFLCFLYALKLIGPAIVGAVEISPILYRQHPTPLRLAALWGARAMPCSGCAGLAGPGLAVVAGFVLPDMLAVRAGRW